MDSIHRRFHEILSGPRTKIYNRILSNKVTSTLLSSPSFIGPTRGQIRKNGRTGYTIKEKTVEIRSMDKDQEESFTVLELGHRFI